MALQALYQSLDALEADLAPVRRLEKQSLDLRDQLLMKLEAIKPKQRLSKSHPLHGINLEIQAAIRKVIGDATSQWEQLQGMRDLSDRYHDRTLLLVCGKVNAGKSSFINTLVELFPKEPVKAFQLQNGEVVSIKGAFKEGNLETTNTIQWVEIGDRLVLMDSPGLHSVTPQNAALARQFLDAADGELWLSGSVSAGQVQELDVLVNELKSGKPVIPVLTKSDYVEEDEDENDPDIIVTLLCPKSKSARKSLEDDVYQRAIEHAESRGVEAFLRHPVSISVDYFRVHRDQPGVAPLSGMSELFQELAWLVNKARSYKPEKAYRQMANYLDQQLLLPIHKALSDGMYQLQSSLAKEVHILEKAKLTSRATVTEHMLGLIPGLVEQHRHARDIDGLKRALEQHLTTVISDETSVHLTRCLDSLQGTLTEISHIELEGFSSVTARVRQVSGSTQKACWSAGLATVGLAAGFFGGPPAAMAGSAIGGLIGNSIGSTMVTETWTTTDTGEVDASAVLRSAIQNIERIVPEQVDRVMDEVINTLRASDHYFKAIEATVAESEAAIQQLLNTGFEREH